MLKEFDGWSPDQDLQLLEELAEAESFEVEVDLPAYVAPGEFEQPWVAYWSLPPNTIRQKSRSHSRPLRSR
jgi:hypothetical protein